MVEMLLKYNADINLKDDGNISPYDIAKILDYKEILQIFDNKLKN
jgi:hypothetical protein